MQNIPLAERIRPRKLSEVIGQKHLIGDKGTLKTAINKKELYVKSCYGLHWSVEPYKCLSGVASL